MSLLRPPPLDPLLGILHKSQPFPTPPNTQNTIDTCLDNINIHRQNIRHENSS